MTGGNDKFSHGYIPRYMTVQGEGENQRCFIIRNFSKLNEIIIDTNK
jgi:hypothetical protein